MTIVWLILATLVALVGVIGAIVPALPGPPLSWLSVLIVYLAIDGEISQTVLLVTLAAAVVVTALDYVAPAIVTKWGGGSRAATVGATIGTFVGLFLAPWGLLLGPLVGAFLGEWRSTSNPGQSLRVALLSFVGFLLTTGLKLVSSLWMAYYIVLAIWHQFT